MREIKEIIIHCAATKPTQNIGATEIERWHRARGFFGIGYHYVIRRDGTLETGRPIEKIGAHAEGHNANSIGICLVGGINDKNGRPECNYTKEQWTKLNWLVTSLEKRYTKAKIIGHNQIANKACPCFSVQKWLKNGRQPLS